MTITIKSVWNVLGTFGCGVILLGCSTQQPTVPSSPSSPSASSAPSAPSDAFYTSFPTKSDACSYVSGQQYPYDWEGSDVGACIQQLSPQPITTMEPDQIGGIFEVPRTTYKDNLVSISSPVGQGVGEWNGSYINGTISTPQGELEFVCAGVKVTGSDRGVCGLR